MGTTTKKTQPTAESKVVEEPTVEPVYDPTKEVSEAIYQTETDWEQTQEEVAINEMLLDYSSQAAQAQGAKALGEEEAGGTAWWQYILTPLLTPVNAIEGAVVGALAGWSGAPATDEGTDMWFTNFFTFGDDYNLGTALHGAIEGFGTGATGLVGEDKHIFTGSDVFAASTGADISDWSTGARILVGLPYDILLDPLTYIPIFGWAAKGAKGAGKIASKGTSAASTAGKSALKAGDSPLGLHKDLYNKMRKKPQSALDEQYADKLSKQSAREKKKINKQTKKDVRWLQRDRGSTEKLATQNYETWTADMVKEITRISEDMYSLADSSARTTNKSKLSSSQTTSELKSVIDNLYGGGSSLKSANEYAQSMNELLFTYAEELFLKNPRVSPTSSIEGVSSFLKQGKMTPMKTSSGSLFSTFDLFSEIYKNSESISKLKKITPKNQKNVLLRITQGVPQTHDQALKFMETLNKFSPVKGWTYYKKPGKKGEPAPGEFPEINQLQPHDTAATLGNSTIMPIASQVFESPQALKKYVDDVFNKDGSINFDAAIESFNKLGKQSSNQGFFYARIIDNVNLTPDQKRGIDSLTSNMLDITDATTPPLKYADSYTNLANATLPFNASKNDIASKYNSMVADWTPENLQAGDIFLESYADYFNKIKFSDAENYLNRLPQKVGTGKQSRQLSRLLKANPSAASLIKTMGGDIKLKEELLWQSYFGRISKNLDAGFEVNPSNVRGTYSYNPTGSTLAGTSPYMRHVVPMAKQTVYGKDTLTGDVPGALSEATTATRLNERSLMGNLSDINKPRGTGTKSLAQIATGDTDAVFSSSPYASILSLKDEVLKTTAGFDILAALEKGAFLSPEQFLKMYGEDAILDPRSVGYSTISPDQLKKGFGGLAGLGDQQNVQAFAKQIDDLVSGDEVVEGVDDVAKGADDVAKGVTPSGELVDDIAGEGTIENLYIDTSILRLLQNNPKRYTSKTLKFYDKAMGGWKGAILSNPAYMARVRIGDHLQLWKRQMNPVEAEIVHHKGKNLWYLNSLVLEPLHDDVVKGLMKSPEYQNAPSRSSLKSPTSGTGKISKESMIRNEFVNRINKDPKYNDLRKTLTSYTKKTGKQSRYINNISKYSNPGAATWQMWETYDLAKQKGLVGGLSSPRSQAFERAMFDTSPLKQFESLESGMSKAPAWGKTKEIGTSAITAAGRWGGRNAEFSRLGLLDHYMNDPKGAQSLQHSLKGRKDPSTLSPTQYADEAARETGRAFFDPRNLSKVERDWVTRFLPFYSFWRQAINDEFFRLFVMKDPSHLMRIQDVIFGSYKSSMGTNPMDRQEVAESGEVRKALPDYAAKSMYPIAGETTNEELVLLKAGVPSSVLHDIFYNSSAGVGGMMQNLVNSMLGQLGPVPSFLMDMAYGYDLYTGEETTPQEALTSEIPYVNKLQSISGSMEEVNDPYADTQFSLTMMFPGLFSTFDPEQQVKGAYYNYNEALVDILANQRASDEPVPYWSDIDPEFAYLAPWRFKNSYDFY